MIFSKKLNKIEKEWYILVCEYAWGCVPIDVEWAMGTKIYKEMEIKLKQNICQKSKGR